MSFDRWEQWVETAKKLNEKLEHRHDKILHALQHAEPSEQIGLLSLLRSNLRSQLQLAMRYREGPGSFIRKMRHLDDVKELSAWMDTELIRYLETQLKVLEPLDRHLSMITIKYDQVKGLFGKLKIDRLRMPSPDVHEYVHAVLHHERPKHPHTPHSLKSNLHFLKKHKDMLNQIHNKLEQGKYKLADFLSSDDHQQTRRHIVMACVTLYVAVRFIPWDLIGVDSSLLKDITWVAREYAEEGLIV